MNNYIKTIRRFREAFDQSLILNPSENIPFDYDCDINFVEGLYIPEDDRDCDSHVVFAGRNNLHDFMTELYKSWEQRLAAKSSTFKMYSGLHAHIILFMSIACIGDKVLLLPEVAGGHHATPKILKRLGLKVEGMIPDVANYSINVSATKELIEDWKPDFIFVDRSDGLYYEDFSWLSTYEKPYKIFDSSQFLTHILAGDFKNPFSMGFDLILTTLHKNYPGPQKAALFTKENDEMWSMIKTGLRDFVSNSHPLQIFKAVITLPDVNIIKDYSQKIIANAMAIEDTLIGNGVPAIQRDKNKIPTQQVWIPMNDQKSAYAFFKRLESLSLMASYRTLPYNLGVGIRIGTAAATRQGLIPKTATNIGNIISEAFFANNIEIPLLLIAKEEIRNIKIQ